MKKIKPAPNQKASKNPREEASSLSKEKFVGKTKLLTISIFAAAIVLASLQLFVRLGHYALWDDEAVDALGAKGILQTGDTTAVLGHNIMAYRNGLLLNKLRIEGEPPFPAYMAALSMKLFGENSWAVRFPFALSGLCSVVLMLYWVWRERVSLATVTTFAIAILGNVSFFLYSRQCHYYGFAILFFLVIAFIYFKWSSNKWLLFIGGVCSALLMASNYSFFVILYVCLLADYCIWRRKEKVFQFTDLAVIFAPQVIMGIILYIWWNPFHTEISHRLGHDTLEQRVLLFFWQWRDLNRCEMISGALFLLAPWVAFYYKNLWLKRALFGFTLYVIGMTVISTQTITDTSVADVRYFCAVIPLAIVIEVITLMTLTRRVQLIAIPIAACAFSSNLPNGGPLLQSGFRVTSLDYINELVHPPDDPYAKTSKWIDEHVREDESIWVLPDYAAYPLMFHQPKAIYAWQLTWPPKSQFRGLPPIHFQGRQLPDYIIAFGPFVQQVTALLSEWSKQGVIYIYLSDGNAPTIDYYWHDVHRPELFWRSFKPVTNYRRDLEAIYIFKRQGMAPAQ